MRLSSVTLSGFRAYRDETTIAFDDLTTIVGRNDVGKSSVLEALEIFFNNETVKLDSGDCSIDLPSQIIEITCDFSDLPGSLVVDAQANTNLANEFLLTEAGTLRIMKRYKCAAKTPKEEVFVMANHPSTKNYDDLLDLNHDALKKRFALLKLDPAGANQSVSSSIRHAIWASCNSLNLSPKLLSVAKEDGKRIWDQLSQYLPMYALFQSDRASKDSDSEVQDPMKFAIATALDEPHVRKMLVDITAAVQARAVDLANRTCKVLAKMDPNLASTLTPGFKADPKWSGLFALNLTDDRGVPVNKRGSGVRRLILVSFFRGEAERQLEQGKARNIIYAIEEPETSQHPHNQRLLLESFQVLAAQQGCQVVLTTHGTGLARLLPIKSLRFVSPSDNGSPTIESGTEETWINIVEALGVIPDSRVRALLCVEGPHDVLALNSLSHALHLQDPSFISLETDPRVAYITLGGSTLEQWVNRRYLMGLGLPEIHIYDSDVKKYKTSVDGVNGWGNRSWACQTKKLEMENYLHSDVIERVIQGAAGFLVDDIKDVPKSLADLVHLNESKVKAKLAKEAFPLMTAELLAIRDPDGEVAGWLRRIVETCGD